MSQKTHWSGWRFDSFLQCRFIFQLLPSVTSSVSTFNSCHVTVVMYIPRPKHLQIQVTHGKHLQYSSDENLLFLFFYEWPFFLYFFT